MALLGQPVLAEFAPFLFGRRAPDPRLLIGLEGKLQTLLLRSTRVTHGLCSFNLL